MRSGLPVSAPVPWDELGSFRPGDVTVRTAGERHGAVDSWAVLVPEPQALPADLVTEGHTIPVARVAAMHEGRRRKRAAEKAAADSSDG